jgi:uncharacterized protein YbaR (Trm112 family)
MAIDLAPELLDILACPNCHGSLAVDHDRDELVCLAADCGLAYPVRQGIPVLLIDEARRPGPDLPVGSASSATSASPTETTTSASSAPMSGADSASGADSGAAGSGTSAASSASAATATSNGSAQPPGTEPGSASGASAADGDERP